MRQTEVRGPRTQGALSRTYIECLIKHLVSELVTESTLGPRHLLFSIRVTEMGRVQLLQGSHPQGQGLIKDTRAR